jgi:hypothetical protein
MMAVLFCSLLLALPGCKWMSEITDATGIGDGVVTEAEQVKISLGVSAALLTLDSAEEQAVHVVSGALLAKLSAKDSVTLEKLDSYLSDSIKDLNVEPAVLTTVNNFVKTAKASIAAKLGITSDSQLAKYLVGIRAILNEFYSQTA